MDIGIIGSEGIVGSACKFGFSKVGHKVVSHDLVLETKLEDVLGTDICFVCLPTPRTEEGPDFSIIGVTLRELDELGYSSPVVIKSTVLPGTTEQFAAGVSFELAHSAEYLRERCNISDFVENHKLLLIGTESDLVCSLVVKCHGNLPRKIMQVSRTQSELAKYYHNVYSGLRIAVANEFYDICRFLGEDYTEVKNALVQSTSMPDIYLDVNEHCRGYSSGCLNRDLPNIIAFSEALGLNNTLLASIEKSNAKYEKTPFGNTRE